LPWTVQPRVLSNDLKCALGGDEPPGRGTQLQGHEAMQGCVTKRLVTYVSGGSCCKFCTLHLTKELRFLLDLGVVWFGAVYYKPSP
jgi:hypothetical protein